MVRAGALVTPCREAPGFSAGPCTPSRQVWGPCRLGGSGGLGTPADGGLGARRASGRAGSAEEAGQGPEWATPPRRLQGQHRKGARHVCRETEPAGGHGRMA